MTGEHIILEANQEAVLAQTASFINHPMDQNCQDEYQNGHSPIPLPACDSLFQGLPPLEALN